MVKDRLLGRFGYSELGNTYKLRGGEFASVRAKGVAISQGLLS